MVSCSVCGKTMEEKQDRCPHCGNPADPLDHAFRPFQKSYDDRVAGRRSALPALREREEAGSRDRLHLLEDIDRRRLRLEAERAEEKRRRERKIVLFAVTGLSLFVLLVVFFLVYSSAAPQ